MSNSLRPHRWQPTRLLCPWDSPGKNTGVSCHLLLQGMHACQVASVVSNSVRPHGQQPTRLLCPQDSLSKSTGVGCHFLLQCMHACMLSRFSHVRRCATLWTAAHQAPLSTGFSRQEYWSGLPVPSPMHTCMHAKSLQSCPTLCNPMDSSPSGSSEIL